MNETGGSGRGEGSLSNASGEEIHGFSGWRTRGYLPHFDGAGVVQHVVFHLGDSLPKSALSSIEEELTRLSPGSRDIHRRRKIEGWLDAGHGACVLGAPVVASLAQNTLLHFDGRRYCLSAWVIMPNHVHALVQPMRGWTVAKIVASWKKFTSRGIGDHQRRLEKLGFQKTGEGVISSVWHREYWDRFMRDEAHFLQTIEYIHQNPVKAGLVARAEEWPWSSAHCGVIGPPGTPIS